MKWKDKRDIIMLSTTHDDGIGSSSKPHMVEDCNNVKLFMDTRITPYVHQVAIINWSVPASKINEETLIWLLSFAGKRQSLEDRVQEGLPFFFQIGIVVLWRQHSGTFFSATPWLKNFANHSAGYHNFHFHRSAATSSGPIALPGLIFLRAAFVSSTVIL
ncbi:unnamed protein product [Heligmosomoides polygyrus]|uniref:Zf-RVT domain-containing protein n=1 Tax=Heligmosomoides polygyrus TaxID=6339 RepID=A0A183FK36_HELPZ|nr:unnamed protein product [Heligmosomoides polygyrus]